MLSWYLDLLLAHLPEVALVVVDTVALVEEDTASGRLEGPTPALEVDLPLVILVALEALQAVQGRSVVDQALTVSQVIRQQGHLATEVHTMEGRLEEPDRLGAPVPTRTPAACTPITAVRILLTIMVAGATTAMVGDIHPGTSIHHFILLSTTTHRYGTRGLL